MARREYPGIPTGFLLAHSHTGIFPATLAGQLWVIHRWLNLDKCLVQDLFPGTRFEMKSEFMPIAGRFVYVKNEKKLIFFVDG